MALIGSDESVCRIVNPDSAADKSEEDNKDVEGTSNESNGRALDAEVEVSGPDKRQHVPGKTADQAHQNGEVWDEDCHQHRENDNSQTEYHSPPA